MNYLQSLLAQNERIAFATRQHWIVLATAGLVNLLFIAIIVAAAILLAPLTMSLSLLLLIFLVVPLGHIAVRLIKWWHEQYIITNRRVIQTRGLITKHVIDSSLEKVNDVVLTQSVWGRMLDYGNVEILTASEIGVNRFERIRCPIKFKTAMLDQKEAMGVRDRAEDAMSGQVLGAADIPAIISELDALRKSGVITEEEFAQKKAALLEKI
jgi:uncharacterized membrane protein YdbT with pleckstrin-like domain